ncbi:hypothetical protein COY07_01490 [Candidatus Peregrinibacteria bacterium CG_4_10_14_0_2_um_filter_43_11]|nr:MAG: hypothetical protein COY07_01490 [Candidatus Peregrinibacteria bacterium CG_4_10_14_0_2_um_filter_43_11]
MTKKNTFDEIHGDLIKSFFELYISNKEFSLKWEREFSLALLTEGRKIDEENISQETKSAFEKLKKLFNVCLNEIKKNKKIIKPKEAEMDFVFKNLLVDFLDHLAKPFKQNLSFLLPHQALMISRFTVYQDYKNYIFAKKQAFKVFVFLSNFSLNTGNIEKNELRLFKEVEIVKNLNPSFFFDKNEFSGFNKHTALVFEYETEKFWNVGNWNTENAINGFQYPHEEMSEKLDTILTALRLLKEGDVGIFAIKYINPSPFSAPFTISPPLDLLFQFKAGRYLLKQSDLKEFKTLYKTIKKKSDCNQLDLCISRFNKSYTRTGIADVIIDLVIAMEAITSEAKDSLTYKIKTQLARLIEVDRTKRKKLAKRISDIYSIRSDLVHGGRTKHIGKGKKFPNNRVLLEESREILRRAINKMLKLTKSKPYQEILGNIIYG